jgi:hypothetical protein
MRPPLGRVPMVCVVMDDKVSDSAKTADLANDAATARDSADAAIREQFDLLKKSDGALTVIGGLTAQASVDGIYPADALLAALRAYQLRSGPSNSLSKSDRAQISKLANFATIGLAWNRRGIKLVNELVKRSEGLPKRYHVVQTVLVRLKRRRQGTMPSVKELGEMLKDAQASKPRKAAKSRETVKALSDSVPTSAPAGTVHASLTPSDIVRALDTLIEDANTPTDIRAACQAIKTFAASKAVTPGVSDAPGVSDG